MPPTAGVGEKKLGAAHAPQQFDGEHDGFPAHALVPVAAAAEGHHAPSGALVQPEFARVPRDGGGAESGDVRVGDAHERTVGGERVCPAAAEYDCDVRRALETGIGQEFRHAVEVCQIHGRTTFLESVADMIPQSR